MIYSTSTRCLTPIFSTSSARSDPARLRATITGDSSHNEDCFFLTIPRRGVYRAATRSIESQAEVKSTLTLTFNSSQSPSPRKWRWCGPAQWVSEPPFDAPASKRLGTDLHSGPGRTDWAAIIVSVTSCNVPGPFRQLPVGY